MKSVNRVQPTSSLHMFSVRTTLDTHPAESILANLQANVCKAALHCLSPILGGLDPSNWPPALLPFNTLLSFAVDGRPKVSATALHSGV